MEAVWKTLYSTRRVKNKTTEEFVYPAYVRHASHATRLRQLAEEATTSRGAALLEKEAVLIESEYDPFTHLEWSEQEIGIQLFCLYVYGLVVVLIHELCQTSKPKWMHYDSSRKIAGK
jgi:hypothetical protein